jgi:hypothetical protein
VALVAVLVAWPALRRFAGALFSDRCGTQALGSSRTRSTCCAWPSPNWRRRTCAQARRDAARVGGFAESGVYVVREMPELTLGCTCTSAEKAYAILYDHPRSASGASS